MFKMTIFLKFPLKIRVYGVFIIISLKFFCIYSLVGWDLLNGILVYSFSFKNFSFIKSMLFGILVYLHFDYLQTCTLSLR